MPPCGRPSRGGEPYCTDGRPPQDRSGSPGRDDRPTGGSGGLSAGVVKGAVLDCHSYS